MESTSPPTTANVRPSAPARDALEHLARDDEERATLHADVWDALRGRGRARREAEERLLGHPRLAPVRLIPLVLAVRDEVAREDPAPRGLSGRVDGFLRALAGSDRQVIGASASGRRSVPGPAAEGGPDRAGRLLRALLDLLPDAALTVRASGRIGVFNRAAARLAGGRRDLLRRDVGALFARPEDLEMLRAELEQDGRIRPRELLLVQSTGEEVPVRAYGRTLDDGAGTNGAGAEGDGHRALLYFHDLTEVHRIRRRLIDTEKLSAMAKIAGSVAHEFRNPLNSLFLSTDLLEDELSGSGALGKAIAPTLAAIREEIERLNQIITHYLSLSKVASNEPEVVDLGSLVEEFAGEWAERAVERGVELRVRRREGDLSASVDPNQVRRVLVNLVENAFDALAGPGDDPAPAARGRTVTLVVRPMRRTVKLTVRDNGPGIPEELGERAFEPFFTSKTRGSGLGLYLVREIVLAHGGAISLASTGGRGTSVAMHWPRPAGRMS
ncbi:MAG: nitrogen regulation protein NR(II) [Planctomycetota bacterium]